MVSYISNGISVSVETFYQQDYSNPLKDEYQFRYHVKIKNYNNFRVKLIGSLWCITDSDGDVRNVETETIIGIQPVIKPFGEYKYDSGCCIHTELGKLTGQYKIKSDSMVFDATIPIADMVVPYKMN